MRTHRPSPRRALCLSVATLAACLVVGSSLWGGATVLTVSGEVIEAESVVFPGEGVVRVRTVAGSRELGTSSVVTVSLEPPLGIRNLRSGIILTTGETWTGELRDLSSSSAGLRSPLFGEVSFPRGRAAAVVVAPGTELTEVLATPPGSVVLRNGDRIMGELQTIHAGVVTLKTDLGKLDISLDRVAYLKLADFPPAWRKVSGPTSAVVLTDGDWLLTDVTGERDGKLVLRPRSIEPVPRDGAPGAEAGTAELTVPKKAVSEVRFLGRGVVYLSDLDPVEVEETPFFDYLMSWRRDLSVGGRRMSLRGHLYRKGLGVHSRCRLTYNLEGKYARFHSLLGIDDEAGRKGNCIFEVWTDGRKRFASGPVTGTDEPRAVVIDVAGARRLELLVDFGEAGDVADRADWADAFLVTTDALKQDTSQRKGSP